MNIIHMGTNLLNFADPFFELFFREQSMNPSCSNSTIHVGPQMQRGRKLALPEAASQDSASIHYTPRKMHNYPKHVWHKCNNMCNITVIISMLSWSAFA